MWRSTSVLSERDPGAAPPPVTDDEADLLAGLRRGQARAYEQLMRRYNRLLFRAARGIVRDDAEAQDAVQEAYLHAFLGLAGFRGEASLATWLTRIVIRQALMQQRRLGRLVFWDGELTADGDEGSDDPLSGRGPATPEQELARAQLRGQLEAAIDLLPPIYRCVFLLRAVEGRSVQDTALALQVSPDVVKTRFLRARAQLRSQLAPAALELAPGLHSFGGHRCEDNVRAVMAQLLALGMIRAP
jgi:RNA polymerase sigma factor, sigma-70 family